MWSLLRDMLDNIVDTLFIFISDNKTVLFVLEYIAFDERDALCNSIVDW